MNSLGPTDLVVIDDDDDLRMLVALTFRLQGWGVHGADDGETGLRLLHELVGSGLAPSVLLDVQMPMVDGWDVLAAIRADPVLADLAVVMFTVSASEADRRHGYALGADGFVAKPFDADDLVDQVTEITTVSATHRRARRGVRPCIG